MEGRERMDRKEILMTVLIGVLVLTTAIQTIQLVRLGNEQIIATPTARASAPVPVASPGGGVGSPSAPSLQNIPSMVGGC
ncbi:hypothetical protein HYS48_01065 [Candidatus Woesearchaeota archaeon]|nr:hypothetical protein [Candidatus Woesearchaeota archaeon]